MLKVFIVDNHRLMREALVMLLADVDDISVIGAAASGAKLLAQVRLLQPDVLLMDIGLEDVQGLEVIARLAEQVETQVILMSVSEEQELIRRALAAGADGYISKQSSPEELVAALRAMADGQPYLCERTLDRLASG